jgi:hypothetical protein
MLHHVLRASRAIAAIALLAATPAFAFGRVDVIKGRVVGPDNKPLAQVSVIAKSRSGEVLKSVATDEKGNYRIAIANGDGLYNITVRAIGYTAVKLRVSRFSDSGTITANATMIPWAATVLSQVTNAKAGS